MKVVKTCAVELAVSTSVREAMGVEVAIAVKRWQRCKRLQRVEVVTVKATATESFAVQARQQNKWRKSNEAAAAETMAVHVSVVNASRPLKCPYN